MKTFFKILVAPFLWLLHSCSPLGNPINEKLSNNHYFNNSKTKVIYSTAGNWFELGKTEMEANIESFKVLNGYLSRDSENIYFEAYRVENSAIDLSSFNVKNGDYLSTIGFDQNHVYSFDKKFHNKKYRGEAKIIKDANPDTYGRKDWGWAYDGQHHFFRNQKIDADYNSFGVLNDYFAKDSSRIFVQRGETFKTLSADLNSFSILENSVHGIDMKHVYWLAFFTENTPLIKIEYNKEDQIESLNRYFLRIANAIYYDGVPMPSIDTKSFEVINELYTKDANYAYFKNQIVEGADVETFRFTKNGLGISDKYGSYRDGKLIPEN